MGRLEVRRYPAVHALLDEAGEFLAAREAEHNLLLGVTGRLVEDPRAFGDVDPYLALVTRDGRVVGVSLRTPPYNLLLSEFDDLDAVDHVAADVAASYETLPGVLGPVPVAKQFAESWTVTNGCRARKSMEARIHAISEVHPPAGVPGTMRKAAAADRPLLVEWMQAFIDEAHADAGRPAERAVAEYLERRGAHGLYLWEDALTPVSLAGGGSPTPNGARIGPVYTPPPMRGRGYASALTASLTQKLLDEGRRFCFLFTDLANPTPNRIYERIGYRRVSEVDEYRFG